MLRDYLPQFIADCPDMAELLAAEQPEIDALQADVRALLQDFFMGSITDRTIDEWENLTGFDHAPEWPIERRIGRVRARMLATETITAAALKDLIERVGGVECEIQEDADNYTALVKFVGRYGIPKYLPDIKKEVELVRPFHIVVDYSFLYTILDDYRDFDLQTLGEYTLAQLSDGVPLQEEET